MAQSEGLCSLETADGSDNLGIPLIIIRGACVFCFSFSYDHNKYIFTC